MDGKVTHKKVAESFGLAYHGAAGLLAALK